MEIHGDHQVGKLILSQKNYIKKVLERFNMDSLKPVSISLASHFRLSSKLSPQNKEEIEYMSHVPYSNVVGCLMYAMGCTRPDISQFVSVISRYMGNPGKEHWQVAKWIFPYLKGIVDIGVVFDRNKVTTTNIVGYTDSDYTGDLDKRRSLSGYVFTL